MPRPTLGARRMSAAERQARQRERRAAQKERWHEALQRIAEATTVREAREIAAEALANHGG